MRILCLIGIISISLSTSCYNPQELLTVSVAQYATFIEETGYITDAEKYGWSIVQRDVFDFEIIDNADWRRPDGISHNIADYPVTQVSYNDAVAYCEWSGTRLPSYNEYWHYAASDDRPIVESAPGIKALTEINIVGNVWDITSETNDRDEIRLAGGSYLCNKTTCNGTVPDRQLYVDKTTGNVHIGFSVIK